MIPEGTINLFACELCGKKEFEFLFKGNIGEEIGSRFSQYAYYDDIFRCKNCRLVAQRQRYGTDEIKEFLQEEEYLDEAIGNLNLVEKQIQFDVIVKIIKKYCDLTDKHLLDVGANTGVFLSVIKDEVKTAQGIEASHEAAKIAQNMFGLKVQPGLIAEVSLPKEHFDIVTMFDVIEHLTTPKEDLKFLYDSLNRSGKLFITTHDIETWFAKISGGQYPMLMYQHFFHFSPNTLSRMLEEVGFKVVGFERFFKSWSCEYIYQLIEKKWPGTKFAKFLRFILFPLHQFENIRKFRIVSPQRDFFIIVAEKITQKQHHIEAQVTDD